MSARAIQWAFQQSVESAPIRLVLLELANFANQDDGDIAWPSVKAICERSKLNRKTVIKAIATLERLGLIQDTKKRVGATKQVIVYHVGNSAENGTLPKESQNCQGTVPNLPPKSPVFTTKESQKRDTETIKEPTKEKKKERKGFSSPLEGGIKQKLFYARALLADAGPEDHVRHEGQSESNVERWTRDIAKFEALLS